MKNNNIVIRETRADDVEHIMDVERRAFGYDKEACLVAELLDDASAKPILSLLAFDGDKAIGHILFTKATFQEQENSPLMHILAPLAVVPEYQREGVGGRLIETGLEILQQWGSKRVFVLGHKEYYPKYGFVPHAAHFGYLPPYAMPEENSEYWMYQSLSSNSVMEKGTIKCSDTLNQPQHWRNDESDR